MYAALHALDTHGWSTFPLPLPAPQSTREPKPSKKTHTSRKHMHNKHSAYKQAINRLNTYGLAVPGALPGPGFVVHTVRITQVSFRVSPWQLALHVLNAAPGPLPHSALHSTRLTPFSTSCRSRPCRPQPAPFPALAEHSHICIHSIIKQIPNMNKLNQRAMPYNTII